jgi:hypothetical protein
MAGEIPAEQSLAGGSGEDDRLARAIDARLAISNAKLLEAISVMLKNQDGAPSGSPMDARSPSPTSLGGKERSQWSSRLAPPLENSEEA